MANSKRNQGQHNTGLSGGTCFGLFEGRGVDAKDLIEGALPLPVLAEALQHERRPHHGKHLHEASPQ
jgi:hypothetical protein